MYLLEQGKAPAVRTKTIKRSGKETSVVVFRFVGRYLQTDDAEMVKAAVEAGAKILEAPKEVQEVQAGDPKKTEA